MPNIIQICLDNVPTKCLLFSANPQTYKGTSTSHFSFCVVYNCLVSLQLHNFVKTIVIVKNTVSFHFMFHLFLKCSKIKSTLSKPYRHSDSVSLSRHCQKERDSLTMKFYFGIKAQHTTGKENTVMMKKTVLDLQKKKGAGCGEKD